MLEWNDEIKWILGRPCFAVARIAWILRDSGYKEIRTKAEDEQALAIFFMLEMYEKYGENWRKEAEHYIEEKFRELKKEKGL